MHHRFPVLFAAALTLSLALPACAGGGSSATGGDEAPSTSSPPAEAAAPAAPAAPAAKSAPAATAKATPVGPSVQVHAETGFSINSSSVPTVAGALIGGVNAFCEPSDKERVRWGGNVSPHVNWEKAPEGTKSFALVVVDPDAPASGDLVNKEGENVPVTAERADFHHWVVVDIPAELTEIAAGASSEGVTEGGKAPGKKAFGLEGVNSYGKWFAGDSKMAGDYGGYDGPCPPWNDEKPHRYVFNLYALDVPTLGLSGAFTGADVDKAAAGHILANASFTGIYILNPAVSLPAPK